MSTEFTVTTDKRGQIVRCVYGGEVGAARVFSAGLDEAKQRAEAQARKKAQERGHSE